MKKLVVISAIVLGGFISKTASAQVGVSLRLNTGYHRVYAPAVPVVINEPVYRENVAPAYYADRDRDWDHDRYDHDYNRRAYIDRARYDDRMYRGYDRYRAYRDEPYRSNVYRDHDERDNRMNQMQRGYDNSNSREHFR